MRTVLLGMLLVGCTDTAEVPATVAHIHVSASCAEPECSPIAEVFYGDCGPSGSTAITPATREVEVITNYDAENITGYVQMQYTSDQVPPGRPELVYLDQVLTADDDVEVYSAYEGTQLYRLTATGDVLDIDTTKLTAANGNTLQFQYTAYGRSAQEDHVIDASMSLRIETDSPGIMDACCSVGRSRDAGLVLLVLAFVLRRRR